MNLVMKHYSIRSQSLYLKQAKGYIPLKKNKKDLINHLYICK